MFNFLFQGNLGDIIAPIASPEQQLLIAIQNNQHDKIQELLDIQRVSPLCQNDRGVQPIHMACQMGNRQLAERLLGAGCDVNATDRSGNTPLHAAAKNCHVDMVKWLVGCGAQVAHKNSSNATPYDVATNHIVRQFLLPLQLKAEAGGQSGHVDAYGGTGLAVMGSNFGAPPSQFGPPPHPTMGGYGAMAGTMQGMGPGGGTVLSSGSPWGQPAAAEAWGPPTTSNAPLPLPTPGVMAASYAAPPPAHPSTPLPAQPPAYQPLQPPLHPSGPPAAPQAISAATHEAAPVMVAPPTEPARQPQVPGDGSGTHLHAGQATGGPGPVLSPVPQHVEQIGPPPPAIMQGGVPMRMFGRMSGPSSAPPSTAGGEPAAGTSSPASSYLPTPPLSQKEYKPIKADGFHSSASDKELQKRYGHTKIARNVGPPPVLGSPMDAGMPPGPFMQAGGPPPYGAAARPRYVSYNPAAPQVAGPPGGFNGPPPPGPQMALSGPPGFALPVPHQSGPPRVADPGPPQVPSHSPADDASTLDGRMHNIAL